MVLKAFRTKNLRSYSLSNILLSNVGNVIHSIYVFHLPPGPIWLLHSFYLVSMGLMLVWYLRYEQIPSFPRSALKLTHNMKGELCHDKRTEQSHCTPFLRSL
jgi:hypothetical protein